MPLTLSKNPFDDLNKLIYEPVEAVNESLHKAIKPPSEVIRNPDEALNEPIRKVFGNSSEVIPRPVEAPSVSSSTIILLCPG